MGHRGGIDFNSVGGGGGHFKPSFIPTDTTVHPGDTLFWDTDVVKILSPNC